MKLLFLDTETTGFPTLKERKDSPKQPQLVSVYANLMQNEKEISSCNFINSSADKADSTVHIHGISSNTVRTLGQHPLALAYTLTSYLDTADLLVAYNTIFDVRMISLLLDLVKRNLVNNFDIEIKTCCMMKSVKSHYGKRISLEVAYKHYFDTELDWHTAAADTIATIMLFQLFQHSYPDQLQYDTYKFDTSTPYLT